MTTEPIKGTHYFCVDVESASLRTWEEGAALLTVGVVVVDGKGNVVDDFYVRIENQLHPSWYHESMPAISETQEWWRKQEDVPKQEAYSDLFRDRTPAPIAARKFYDFVVQYGLTPEERIFVASPVQFDWMWVDYLLSQGKLPDPFWYHPIDIWSFRHGIKAQKRTGKVKGQIDLSYRPNKPSPSIPHHALSDAFALAEDLCAALEKQPIKLDEPYLGEAPAVEEQKDEAEEPVLPTGDADEEETAPETEE